ncbi:metallophosphoesterase family protein [Fodinibius saliphilus]|uniref:metallophosphoesterase family protein n=1 Tax=Fodinibius saliphilus TaxID=1920650 RepID=UPI001108ED36|nr:metallophosphoesterase family protein [Fodinibius saliphilus]
MKIALLSDIHANLPALEAVLSDIEKRAPDAVYCLGDLVGYAPWPNEVIAEIRGCRIPTIAGNYDYGVGLNSNDCGCAYKTEKDKERGQQSIKLTNELISEDNRSFLKTLPAHIRLEIGYPPKQCSMLMVHGSPRKINEYLFEDRTDKSFKRIMEGSNAGLLAFGHTHKPFHKVIEDGDSFKHAINIGSVGKPKDGDSRACYTMLEWDGTVDCAKPDWFSVSFIRVGYEIEKTMKAIKDSALPNAFADMLQHAY